MNDAAGFEADEPTTFTDVAIGPQPGPQTEFLSTDADIAIYGGAAGGGKSYGLLLDPVRHYENSRFGGVIFRRQAVEVRNEGGLWDDAKALYPMLGAEMRDGPLQVLFPSGARLKFAHLEHEKTVLTWQGSQIAFMGYDELTHFTRKQFFYMLSRNRSTSGVRPYVRATTNPDADSWVREFIAWWIDEETGLPIPERSGQIRWFIRQGDDIIWADTEAELVEKYGEKTYPKSVTFIPSTVYDNKILLEKDPSYLSNLHALSRVERERLLGGNWNVRATAGMFFRRTDFELVDHVPAGAIRWIRYWDRAATEPNSENPDPDWTVGLKLGQYPSGKFIIADVRRDRLKPLGVEQMVKNTASQDGHDCFVGLEQDPGSAGKGDIDRMVRLLSGYPIKITKPTKNKIVRAGPVSAQCENGNVLLVRAPWNEAFFKEVENFPEGAHDDIVDTLSGAFNELATGATVFDVL